MPVCAQAGWCALGVKCAARLLTPHIADRTALTCGCHHPQRHARACPDELEHRNARRLQRCGGVSSMHRTGPPMTCFCVMASSPPIPLYCHFFRSAVNAVGALAAAGVRAPNMKAIERSAAGVPAAGACFASCAAAVGRPPFALPSPLAAFAGAAAAGAAGALRFGAIRGGEGRGAELGPPQPWSTCEISRVKSQGRNR